MLSKPHIDFKYRSPNVFDLFRMLDQAHRILRSRMLLNTLAAQNNGVIQRLIDI